MPLMNDTNTFAYNIENENTLITAEQSFQHMWTQFHLCFYGATNYPTDVTVREVSFHDSFGPNRQYYNVAPDNTTTLLPFDAQWGATGALNSVEPFDVTLS